MERTNNIKKKKKEREVHNNHDQSMIVDRLDSGEYPRVAIKELQLAIMKHYWLSL